ncbi:aminotransferase class V-fold PLP-dependent enzyme [Aureibaculum luteum]|uniref:aminotransferase class V-fold PLP-dependent enzyme n=1 Tax=Aureibaculum luteum TaxID=1548456 RepID=UPI0018E53E82|nr:aminotransferase class V-fold PLP-dependent enzyme [Aureibaculum luteum]
MNDHNNHRRKFIKTISTAMAGFAVAPAFTSTNFDKVNNSTSDLSLVNDNSEAYWEKVKQEFLFVDGLKYFNNASLGSSPVLVQRATRNFRETLDSFPSKYMWGGWDEEKEKTRQTVADFFSVSNEEIALIHNTTEGMNLIARSMDLKKGDEVILIDHEHTSGTIPWEVWQETKGVKLVRPKVPILPKNKEELIAIYKKAITSKTKVISMCHMVNTNGMILPVKEVSEMAHKKGILVAVDGAQAAGMFSIDLHDLGCDFYTVSSHKWLFSPKGVGIFYSKKESQQYLKPLMVCKGHKDETIRRLENYNTRNLPEVLGLGASINFLNAIGLEKIHNRTYELKKYFRNKIAVNASLKLKTPAADNLSAAIQVVEVIGKPVSRVKTRLIDQYGIDCRPMSSFGLNAVRLSFAIYITKKDIDYLVNALESI